MLQTGCCQCDNLSPTGWIAVFLLLIFFWPLFWIPFVMPECYEVSHLVVLKSCPCTCHSKKNRRLQRKECPISALPAPIPLALGMLILSLTKWALQYSFQHVSMTCAAEVPSPNLWSAWSCDTACGLCWCWLPYCSAYLSQLVQQHVLTYANALHQEQVTECSSAMLSLDDFLGIMC